MRMLDVLPHTMIADTALDLAMLIGNEGIHDNRDNSERHSERPSKREVADDANCETYKKDGDAPPRKAIANSLAPHNALL